MNNCTKCELGSAGARTNCMQSLYESAGVRDRVPRITLVIFSPSPEDDIAQYPLSDYTIHNKTTGAQVVWDVVDQLHIPRREVNVVPLVRCRAEKVSAEQTITCLDYLWEELRKYRPEIVVCMGLPVTKVLAGVGRLKTARGMYGNFSLPRK